MGVARKKTVTTKRCNIYINYKFVHFGQQRTDPGKQTRTQRRVGNTVGKNDKKMAKKWTKNKKFQAVQIWTHDFT